MQFVKENLEWTTVAWTNVSMTLASLEEDIVLQEEMVQKDLAMYL